MANPKSTRAKPIPEMMKRQIATEKTMARFATHSFRLGQADCIKMFRYHMIQMGHRGLPKADYKGEKGAAAALKQQGVSSVDGLVDKFLPRIAPAWRAGTIVICLGRKFLGWHPDHPMLAVIEPSVENPYTAAWRV